MHFDSLRLFSVVILGLALLAPRALAEGDTPSWQRKLDLAKQQIQELVDKGRELEAAGRSKDAQDLFARAEKMEVAVRRAFEKAKQKVRRKRDRKPDDRNRLLGDAKRGVRALEALGYKDAAQQMQKILEEVFAAERRRTADRSKERAALARRAQAMKIAVHGLVEIDRPDLAHRLEHGVHALELAAVGRDDEEAKTVRKTAPRVAEMRGLVAQGLRAWQKLGDKRRSAKLEWLLDDLQEKRGADAREATSLDAIEGRLQRLMQAMQRLGEDLEQMDVAEKARR